MHTQNAEISANLRALDEKIEVLRQNSIYQQCQINVHSAISKTLFIMLLAQDGSPLARETTVKNIFDAIRSTVGYITYTGIPQDLADYISEQSTIVLENELSSVLTEFDALCAAKASSNAARG
ncbi:hypothetical protein N5853_11360 [Bartonella sp. HY329]|uniref:hypothetical protein n=1 Tax=unclassified Bartonella TaxID=2645622 RepID=UPI0021CA474E|nr:MULTISPECIES: hypothetical protein [unclassified Bartonella]UXM94686.1 hypothetical protein N5853_11360 [Bartonella sp. HY329]UXN09009.1 hypothetical protein N5852_11370 [Bartonella sp. HY328]